MPIMGTSHLCEIHGNVNPVGMMYEGKRIVVCIQCLLALKEPEPQQPIRVEMGEG